MGIRISINARSIDAGIRQNCFNSVTSNAKMYFILKYPERI